MVRPTRPSPLLLEESVMLFSGSCSTAEQSTILSPVHSDSPKPNQPFPPPSSSSSSKPPTSTTSTTTQAHNQTERDAADPLPAGRVVFLSGPAAGVAAPGSVAAIAAAAAAAAASASAAVEEAKAAKEQPKEPKSSPPMKEERAHPPRHPNKKPVLESNHNQMGEDDVSIGESTGSSASCCQSNGSTPLQGGRTPTFSFFKRSISASASLAAMGSGHSSGCLSASTTPSSSGVTGAKLKTKKRHILRSLTPKGMSMSSQMFSAITPKGIPSNSASFNNNNTNTKTSKNKSSDSLPTLGQRHMSSPPGNAGGFGSSFITRFRRRASLPLDDKLRSHKDGSGKGEKTHTHKRAQSEQDEKELTLSTMDFQYDGSKILDYLYVGGENIPSQDALAETFNITHIVNTTVKAFYPHHDPDRGDYAQLYLLDAVKQQITAEALEEAFTMIEKARATGHACLVHCRNGMSRSTSIIIAYLMRYYKMPLLEAFNFVRERRPCTSPNPGFMRQLASYEKQWHGKNSLDCDHYADDRFAAIEDLELTQTHTHTRDGSVDSGGSTTSEGSSITSVGVCMNGALESSMYMSQQEMNASSIGSVGSTDSRGFSSRKPRPAPLTTLE